MIDSLLLLAQLLVAPTDWRAPTDHEHLVPRLSGRTGRVFANLRYEGNNRALRSAFEDDVPRCADAERTQGLAARTAGLFVLRDALFSQQDHPVHERPCALMLPPNWVTVAVHDAMDGRVTEPVVAPPPEDDAAWERLATPAALFGGFPQSESLHGWATRARGRASADDRRRIDNARHSVHELAAAADRLRSAAARGPEAVAREGAELIASSDRAYFGDTIRHDRVIPLFVENPTEHEVVDEGKGLTVHGRALDPAAIALTRREVYRQRLLDGAMAIERYDITKESDVQRALQVLAELVPAGSGPGHLVYVWVGGPLIEGTERVADVHDRMPTFLAALAKAPIEHDRVIVFARPVFQAKGKERKDLQAAADRARDQGVLYGVNMIGPALRSMMGWD